MFFGNKRSFLKKVSLFLMRLSLKWPLPPSLPPLLSALISLYLPEGLLPCHSGTPAWRRRPPWRNCSRRSPRPRAGAAAATGPPAAARRRSTGTCRSPTWTGPPTPLSCRTAAETDRGTLSGRGACGGRRVRLSLVRVLHAGREPLC